MLDTYHRHPQGMAKNPDSRHLTDEERRRIRDRALDIVVARRGEPTVKARTYWRWGNKAGLKVNFAGPYAGTWYDWDGEAHGDMIAWIQREYDCGFREAIEIALQEREPDPIIAKVKAKASVEKAIDQSAFARQQLHDIRPVLNTPAFTYLTEFRGIPSDVVHALDAAGVIRFLPRHKSNPGSVYTAPAFALLASDLNGKVHGFQAVRLQANGNKREGRAVKLSCGALKDNAAAGWLSRGAGDVILAEGPEDAITAYAVRPDDMVGAALGGIKRLVVAGAIPAGRRTVIVAQNDDSDSNAAKSLREACEMLVAEGFEVLLAYPPAGIKDANDLLRERGLDAVRAMLDNARPFLPPTPPKGKADEALAEIDKATKPEPYWPRCDQDAITASRQLNALIEEWMCRVERWLDAKTFSSDQESAFLHEGMTKAEKRQVRRQIAEATRNQFPDVDLKNPPRLQIAAAAGLGKSSTLRKAYLRHPKLWRYQFHGFLPTLKLAAEFEEKMLGAIDGSLDAPMVALHKGRSHECQRPGTMLLAGKVPSLYSATCKFGEIECRYYAACGYINSWLNQGPGMHLFVHDYMTLPKILKFPTADFAFVDEDATQTLLSHSAIGASVLAEPPTYQTAALTDEQEIAAALGLRVMVALTSGSPILSALRAAGVTKKDLQKLASWCEPTDQGPLINPGMSEKQIAALASRLKVHDGEIVGRIMRQLARELRYDRADAHGVAYYGHGKGHDAEAEGKISLHRTKKIRSVPKGIPLLIIDADADLTTNRILYGESLVGRQINAPRKGRVVQVSNATLAKSYVAPELAFRTKTPDEAMVARAQAVRASILAFIAAKAIGGKRVLIGTNKPIRRMFTGEPEGKLPVSIEAHGVTWTHYGAILGVDDWKTYDVVILIGREQITAGDAERQARAIYCDCPDALNLTGEYRKVERHHRLRDGSTVGVDVYEHEEVRVQHCVEAKRERQMGQMIDRLRLIHGSENREIFILCNLPLPGIEVDEMTTLEKLLNDKTPQQQLQRLIDYARAQWGVLPLVPEFLAENAKEIVGSVRTARRMVKEFNTQLTANAQLDSLLRVGRLSTARFWRKVINQKFPSVALFFDGRANGTLALEKLFGRVEVQAKADDDMAESVETVEEIEDVQEAAAPFQEGIAVGRPDASPPVVQSARPLSIRPLGYAFSNALPGYISSHSLGLSRKLCGAELEALLE
jgi:hypothetical protein